MSARERRPRLGPIEVEAFPVEAVDALPRVRGVERDRLDDLFPAQAADLDAPQGRHEPMQEPRVALPRIILDSAADLAVDGLRRGLPDEDPVVDPGLGGED